MSFTILDLTALCPPFVLREKPSAAPAGIAAATSLGSPSIDRLDDSDVLDLLQWLDRRFAPGTDLAAAFPGGIHFQRQEPGILTRPHVLVDVLAEVPAWCTEEPYSEAATVQCTIVCDSVPDARRLRALLTRHPTEGLDRIAGSDLGGGDSVFAATRAGGATRLDLDPNPEAGEAVLSSVDYVFLLYRSV